MENGRFAFWAPLENLRARYDVYLRLTGTCVVDFLLVFIGLFARCYRWEATSEYRLKIVVSLQQGQLNPIIQVEGVASHQPFFLSQNYAKWSFVWYSNLDRFFFSFVTIHAFDRQTDRRTNGRTDERTIARPRLHSTQRGKVTIIVTVARTEIIVI